MRAIVQDRYGEVDALRLERTYPLDQVPDALRHVAAGTVRGKVAITL